MFRRTRGIVISGLQRGKDYWVPIRAVGLNGPGAWSNPATLVKIFNYSPGSCRIRCRHRTHRRE
jgi:hypothetical protein